MKHCAMNVEKSLELTREYEKELEIKMCYNNIFTVSTMYYEKFRKLNWKVCYGYITVMDNLLARHCYILDESGKVIDPTITKTKTFDKNNPPEYYTFYEFKDYQYYLDTIENNDYLPDLYYFFYHLTPELNEWASKNNKILLG